MGLSSFFGSSSFWGHLHFCGCLNILGLRCTIRFCGAPIMCLAKFQQQIYTFKDLLSRNRFYKWKIGFEILQPPRFNSQVHDFPDLRALAYKLQGGVGVEAERLNFWKKSPVPPSTARNFHMFGLELPELSMTRHQTWPPVIRHIYPTAQHATGSSSLCGLHFRGCLKFWGWQRSCLHF